MRNGEQTLLYVEDEAIIPLGQQRILESYGFTVFVAHSGEKGVATALSHPEIDLVIMDIDLDGGIDGTEAAEQIPAKRDIPLIFLTSHREREYVDRAQAHRNEAILRAIPDLVFVFSRSGRIEDLKGPDDALCRMTGYTKAELVGSDVVNLIHPDDRETVRAAIAQDQNNPYEVRALRKDGSEFITIIRARLLTDRGAGFDMAGLHSNCSTHLGLNPAHILAEQLGGTFHIDSHPGAGTAWVEFPYDVGTNP